MDNSKKCPLSIYADADDCRKEECEWWAGSNCVIRDIAFSLYIMTEMLQRISAK